MVGQVKVKDVAEAAAVSIVTVSRVLNNHSNVTEQMKERVLKAASDLGYFNEKNRPNQYQQELKIGSNSTTLKEIGFLFVTNNAKSITSNPFWSHILQGVESEARKSNLRVTYRAIPDTITSSNELLASIYEMRLDGILLVGSASKELVELIQSTRIPTVLVDNDVAGRAVEAVLSDNFGGAKQAVQYLIAEGHQQIAYIGGPKVAGSKHLNKLYTIGQREEGYLMVLLSAGLPIDYNLIEAAEFVPEGGYEACKRLLARKIPFTALFCANDTAAIGAIKALHEAGLKIPQDISVVGFDDIDFAANLTPALTTIKVDKEAMGTIALVRLLAQAADPTTPRTTTTLKVELIKRESVKRLKLTKE